MKNRESWRIEFREVIDGYRVNFIYESASDLEEFNPETRQEAIDMIKHELENMEALGNGPL